MRPKAQEKTNWFELYQAKKNIVWIRVDKDNSIEYTPSHQSIFQLDQGTSWSDTDIPLTLLHSVERVRLSKSREVLFGDYSKSGPYKASVFYCDDECVFVEVELISDHLGFNPWAEYDNLPVGILVADMEMRIVHVNPALCAMLSDDSSVDDWKGRAPSDIVCPEDWEIVKSNLTEASNSSLGKGNDVFSFRLNHSYKKWFKAMVSIEKNKWISNKEYYVGVIFSIDEEKDIEMKLRRSEDRLRSMFYDAQGGVVLSNEESRIVAANDAFCEMLGYQSEKDLRGLRLNELTFEEDRELEAELLHQMLLNRNSHYRIEKRYVTKSGELVWADVIVSAVWNESDILANYISIIQNIQQAKENEYRMLSLSKLKDKFFSIISHDLKNPLSAIGGLADLAEETMRRGQIDDAMEMVGMIKMSTHRIHDLLINVLDWSRSQQGNLKYTPSQTPVDELLKEVLGLLESSFQRKNIHVEKNIDHGLRVESDQHMLKSILINLLSNAVKFTERGGRITLSVKRAGQNVGFLIQDTGIGMSADQVEEIFQMNIESRSNGTEDEPGTGLGLILVQEFIQAHGSELSVHSEQGIGTEFQFLLRSSN